MLYVGLDDTDTLEDPGTNQLARHLVRELADEFSGRMILRHQLLQDPRVPCTKKNGCASIEFEVIGTESKGEVSVASDVSGSAARMVERLRALIVPWCPAGSDPGFCVAPAVSQAVMDWGMRVQRELVTQHEARAIAAANGVYLEGLGGTEDGVIGALAAVGLMSTRNDGRVVHFGAGDQDLYEVTGVLSWEEIRERGVDEVVVFGTGGADRERKHRCW
jgi:tRNA(Ile2) C34 agmatinyltransferase TiaS